MTTDVAARRASGSPAPRRVSRPVWERADQTASWPAILAWGAGLILTSMGAGALTGNDLTPTGARVLGAPVALAGLAVVAWGAIALARARTPWPRAVIAGCLGGVALAVALLVVDPIGTSIVAVAAASALLLALAMLAAFRLRRPAAGARTGILGLLVAGALVAALAAPAMTASTEARLTQGNAGVPVVFRGHH